MIKRNVVGIMSGSSLDGVDIADVDFVFDGKWHFEILCAESQPYSADWKKRLSDAFNHKPEELHLLDKEYGTYLGELVSLFVNKHNLHPELVASHGHTVFHRPEQGYTFQIGDGSEIARKCGVTVINDFRSEDVSKGGQGAPLVPIGDKLLFSDYSICLNIGGIANLSYDLDGKRIAYDICIANQILNYLASLSGKDFDREGDGARSGRICKDFLASLNASSYYSQEAPKSLGREFFEKIQKPLIEKSALSVNDMLATASEHIAIQIGNATSNIKPGKMLITGGGALNAFLVERIRKYCRHEIVVPSELIVNYKEALIFGFLGLLKILGKTNVLCSVTGASSDSSSGRIWAV